VTSGAQRTGDVAAAQRHQEAGVEVTRRLLGEAHDQTQMAIDNLAHVLTARMEKAILLHASGEMAGEQREQEVVQDTLRRLFGDDHPGALNMQQRLAEMLHALGDEHPEVLTAPSPPATTEQSPTPRLTGDVFQLQGPARPTFTPRTRS
jgi:hypothetical protein